MEKVENPFFRMGASCIFLSHIATKKSDIDRTLLESKVRNEVHEINHPELIEHLKQFG